MFKVSKAELEKLLSRTQRVCNINGKPIPQVKGCVISGSDDNLLSTTNIVRDGISSVATFSCLANEVDEQEYVIPDIEKMLGVLKPHRGVITLESKEDKIVIKSSGRQTTLSADSRALAFPHTKKTVSEWYAESKGRIASINPLTGSYKMRDGSIREPFIELQIMGSEFKNAIDAGNVNGQKVNRCLLKWDSMKRLYIESGNILLGKTETCLASTEDDVAPFEFEFEGGLEKCLTDGLVNLYFLDFTEESQGYSIVLVDMENNVIFQRGVV